jgi:ubiquinone/menaquinone biosynthesis C-methylase UbiE
MESVLDFDEENARRLVAVYMTPDVVDQRRAIRAALALKPGEHVLDIGSGPGFLAGEMAEEVGADGRVHGIDPSDSMLAIARRSETPVDYGRGDALTLPFGDEQFDVVVSTQVYEYVDDIEGALAEARRVLRPGGRLLVLDTDWDSIVWHSGDRERMERVLAVWNEHLADPHLPRRLPMLMRAAGLEVADVAIIPILNHGADRDTFSAGMRGLVAAYVDGRGGVTLDETRAWVDDLESLGDDYFFSLNRYLFVAKRS